MRCFLAAAAVATTIGASLVSAVPLERRYGTGVVSASGPLSTGSSGISSGKTSSNSSSSSGSSSSNSSGSSSGSSSSGVSVAILGDNFPFSNPQQIASIEAGAHGDLSDAKPPPPGALHDDTKTSVQFVAFNEILESAYFQQLLNNITNGVAGYTFENRGVQSFIENAVKIIVKQEELHAINVEKALVAVFQTDPIQPCRYQFPVTNFADAINLAARFTDVVLGTLPDIILHAGLAGDAGFTPGVAAAMGNEGEQEGWFRTLQGLPPSELPFLTRSTRNFAFSALQDFVIPGSCPNANAINLTIFQPFTAPDPPARTTDLTFTFPLKPTRDVPNGIKSPDIDLFGTYGGDKWQGKLFVTYLNQQNTPKSVPVKNVNFDLEKQVGTAIAQFPFDVFPGQQMNGLTIATLTTSNNLATAEAMDAATILGPALLETIQPSMGKQYE